MGNRGYIGGIKTNGFRPIRSGLDFVTTSRLLSIRICTHPPQGSKLLFFSAVSVRCRFQEDLTAKWVQKLHTVSLNCLTEKFVQKNFSSRDN